MVKQSSLFKRHEALLLRSALLSNLKKYSVHLYISFKIESKHASNHASEQKFFQREECDLQNDFKSSRDMAWQEWLTPVSVRFGNFYAWGNERICKHRPKALF